MMASRFSRSLAAMISSRYIVAVKPQASVVSVALLDDFP
jgi:hypothetical protein